jgi:CheY-like chemotaxis protein
MPIRLLCADDEDDIRTILRLALSLDRELDVHFVTSGAEALAQAKDGGFDAIVLDGMMPDLDGYETCRRLKADPATARIPVVFLTAKSQSDERRRALALGAIACLTKPFDPMTIAGDLRRALGR